MIWNAPSFLIVIDLYIFPYRYCEYIPDDLKLGYKVIKSTGFYEGVSRLLLGHEDGAEFLKLTALVTGVQKLHYLVMQVHLHNKL